MGVLRDVFYIKELQDLGTMDLVVYETYDDLTKALVYGQIDALMQNLTNIDALIKQNAYTNLRLAGELQLPTVSREDLRFGIRSDEPLLHSIVQKGLEDITQDEKRSLTQKWLGARTVGEEKKVVFTREEREYLEQKGPIRMAVDPAWMPLEGINDKSEHEGIAADVLQELMKNSGLNLELVPTQSWEESVNAAKMRQIDIFSLAMRTPEREEYMDFTTPYLSYPFVIATLSSRLFIDDVKTLSGEKLAMLKGYAAAELFRIAYPEIEIVEVDTLMEGIQMVRSEEVFGYVDSLPTLTSAIQREGMTDIRVSGKFDEEWELSIAVRNDEPQLLGIMQKALDSVDPETIRTINNRWLAVRYDSRVDYSLLYKVIIGFVLVALVGYWRHRELYRVKKTIEEKNHQLQEAYEKYSWLAENMDDVVWVMGVDGELIYISPSVERMRGYTPDEVMTQSFEELFCEKSLPKVREEMESALETVRRGEVPSLSSIRVEQPCRDGSTVWTEVNARLIVDREKDQMRFIGLTRNITDTLAYEEELEELALTDRLTGLYNRHKLDEILEEQLDLANRYQVPFAVMIMDIDHFKQVNDTYGHNIGDSTLIDFALILASATRQSDMVGRWGGEEFMVIIPQAEKNLAREMAERLRKTIESHEFDTVKKVTASFGMALHRPGENISSLISRSDAALYDSKKNGRNRVTFSS